MTRLEKAAREVLEAFHGMASLDESMFELGEALGDAITTDPALCGAVSPTGIPCIRPAGHGEHHANSGAMWWDSKEPTE
jgi:hypothetical protein